MYIKIENDDSKVEQELRRRGIWNSFISSQNKTIPFCWSVFEKSGSEQVDIFVGYSGFSNITDNGFTWFKIKNPQSDPKVMEIIIHSLVSNLTGEINTGKNISRVNVCAYCKSNAKLTREHVFPQFIIKKETDMLSFSEKAAKIRKMELTTKDVCAKCNNEELSRLDDYICRLYDSHFAKIIYRNEALQFSYDFGKLARWLLKVSYNSSRSMGIDADVLGNYTTVILTNGEIPKRLMIFLDIVTPTTIQSENLIFKEDKEIAPRAIRCARIHIPDNSLENYTIRLIALNSYYFYLVIIPEEIDDYKIYSKEVINQIIPGKYLDPDNSNIEVVGSERDALTNYLSMAKVIKDKDIDIEFPVQKHKNKISKWLL